MSKEFDSEHRRSRLRRAGARGDRGRRDHTVIRSGIYRARRWQRLRLYGIAAFLTACLVLSERSGSISRLDEESSAERSFIEFVRTDNDVFAEPGAGTPVGPPARFSLRPGDERAGTWRVKEALFFNHAASDCSLQVRFDRRPISTLFIPKGESRTLLLPVPIARSEVEARLRIEIEPGTDAKKADAPISEPDAGRLVFKIEDTESGNSQNARS